MTSIFPQCVLIHVIDLGLADFVSFFFGGIFFLFTPFENNTCTIQVWGFLYFRSKYEFGETILEKLFRGKSSK